MMRAFKIAFAGTLAAAAMASMLAFRAGAADQPGSAGRLEDRAAIQDLIVRYGQALDALDADAYAAVFAEDADLSFGGNTYHGRAAIRKVVADIKARRASQPAATPPLKMYHVITNTLIEFVNDHEARHRSYWQTVSGPSSGPFKVGGMGVYEDVIVKRDGRWLIGNRKIMQ